MLKPIKQVIHHGDPAQAMQDPHLRGQIEYRLVCRSVAQTRKQVHRIVYEDRAQIGLILIRD